MDIEYQTQKQYSKLSKFLNISIDWLLTGKEFDNNIGINLMNKYNKLTDIEKIKVETYIDFLILEKLRIININELE